VIATGFIMQNHVTAWALPENTDTSDGA